jgi:glucose/arabinose dehydrogenase
MPQARILLPALALLAACNPQSSAVAQDAANPFTVTMVADFDSPWAMTILPEGWLLVTEKDGRMLMVSADGKERATVTGTPAVSSAGQGALMDVVLHPKFAQNRLVYFSYSEARADGLKGVVLARGMLTTKQVQCVTAPCPPLAALEKVETLFRADPYVTGNGHFSGRIAFASDGHLFFTAGERQKFTPAQDPKATLGKVLRFKDDGTPAGDPGLTAKGFHPAIWSYGHRNLLGLAFDAAGNLWEQEMGPKGGDEVNLFLAGHNYGYPNVSNGDHYDGRDIPDHKPGDGYEAPKVWWNPSISPGGLMLYSGKLFPQWKGDLFLGGLSGKALIRVDVNGTDATKGDQWDMGARIREVEQGPDGAIWLLEDGDDGSQGRLLKLMPVR